MKRREILVGEVKIAELRKGLRALLALKRPTLLQRRSRVVAVLFSLETSWYGTLEHPNKERVRLVAEVNAVIRKLIR